ncbi:Gfo/Idh/MocA family oxidoreductase [Chelatococcus daeguensis]|uniref:Gfo/Idh/MocA family protein n=1 Tax=Chelatococcus TaxID=28209 RepID=UPI0007ABC0D2|nr:MULTISPECIES: Gfo/Idh/MocA family oxidoreductase [Chelatococcus]KZE35489.1 NAD-binding protein [Chelatococcus daeguensis]MBM3085488.1 Gfo/Idh/MocA family oxidoreductase [Chelatococcus daeguensis]
MEPVRWGILSTARIGREKVVPAMMKSPSCKVVAVASRDLEAARAMASALGIERAYGSYEELLADPEIEAVYNPLPNHLHVPLTLAAAAAGKHVLCEKPIALDAAEARQLEAVADKVLVAEAFMIRHHPQWLAVHDMVRAGEIGELRLVNVLFSYFNADPANIRNMPEIGGGALYDIGCYAVVSGRFLFEAEPQRVVSLLERDPTFCTDRLSSGLADFGGGRQLVFSVSTQLVPFQRVEVLGTKGRIEIRIPFNAPQGEGTRILVDSGAAHDDAAARFVAIAPCDQYTLQGEAFSRAVRGVAPLAAGIEDAVTNMRILDALYRSAKSGAWEGV